jgi:hypothetical protein
MKINMKTRYFTHILILAASTVLVPMACRSKQDKQTAELQSALEAIDKNVGSYDPSLTIKEGSSHRALSVRYAAGAFTVDSISEPRKGRLPFKLEEKSTLPFSVTFYDAQNKLIGGYSIENPVRLRTCESGEESIRLIDTLEFEILIPDNRSISTVKITENQKELATFNLSPK